MGSIMVKWALGLELIVSLALSLPPRRCSTFFKCRIHHSDLLYMNAEAVTDTVLGERLHVLHHAGDIESVASLFCREIGVSTSDEKLKNNHYFLRDRYYYNIGLSSLLTLNQKDKARAIYSELVSSSTKIYPDTVHMFMRDAFKRGAASEASELFNAHKNVATTMTVNIIMEGYRKMGDYEAAKIFVGRMQQLHIEKDAYTYASLVRMAERPRQIVKIVKEAVERDQLSQPFLRCCIETLGKLGDPQEALNVFSMYPPADSDSEEHSQIEIERSGDALLSALLSPRSVERAVRDVNGGFFGELGVPAGLVALHMTGLLDPTNNFIPDELSVHLPKDLPAIDKWGPRGYNLLFTYVGSLGLESQQRTYTRKMNDGEDPKDTEDAVVTLSESEVRLLRLAVRSALRNRVVAAMEAGVRDQLEQSTISTTTTTSDVEKLVPNGRLCDALLRAFSDDVELGRLIWKRDLLPLARKLQRHALSPDNGGGDLSLFLEITEKSFEALMFGSGRCRRPDVGMEIAKAARKSEFGEAVMQRLAKAYLQGCRSADYQRDRTTFFQEILDKSADESLRIELGIVEVPDDQLKKGTKIRIQF